MAGSKLTLSIEPNVIDQAKKYARNKHTSLSKLVQNYLKDIAVTEQNERDPLVEKLDKMDVPAHIKSLSGILEGKYPDNYDFKQVKWDYLKEKHGL